MTRKAVVPILSLIVLLGGCSSVPQIPSKKLIIGSSTGKMRPSWAMKKTRRIKSKLLLVSGQAEVTSRRGYARCLMASDLQAKANLISELRSTIESDQHLSLKGFSASNQELRSSILTQSHLSNLTHLRIEDRFFEKVLLGRKRKQAKYICYSLAALPLKEVNFQIERTKDLGQAGKTGKLSANNSESINDAWEQYFRKLND